MPTADPKEPAQVLYEALEQSLIALEKAGKGFRQQDEEDDWQECPVCRAKINHHGHSASCALFAAEHSARQAIVAWNSRSLAAPTRDVDALKAEIAELRAYAPRAYILSRASEWDRLFREVRGYLHTCHKKHGTDWEGRKHAMAALDAARADLAGAPGEPATRTEPPNPDALRLARAL